MQRKDIADILNDAYAVTNEETGATDTVVLANDLSNIVDFGRSITSGTTTFSDQFLTLSNIIDKVRKTIYQDAEFEGIAPPCFRDETDFAGLKEVINISVGDYDESLKFDVDNANTKNSFAKLFGKELPTVSAKYFGKTITFSQKITRTLEQFEEAFTSPSAMSQFFAHVENAIRVKYDYAVDRLQTFAFNMAVINKISDTYVSGTGSPCCKVMSSGATKVDFINLVKSINRELRAFNKTYTGYVTSTPASKIHLAIRADYYDTLITSLYDTRQPEYLAIPVENIHVMPYFQFADDPDKIANIDENESTLAVDKVIAVIYDERAFGCTSHKHQITAQPIANELGVTNYFHNTQLEYIVNSDLPVIAICEYGGGYTNTPKSSS